MKLPPPPSWFLVISQKEVIRSWLDLVHYNTKILFLFNTISIVFIYSQKRSKGVSFCSSTQANFEARQLIVLIPCLPVHLFSTLHLLSWWFQWCYIRGVSSVFWLIGYIVMLVTSYILVPCSSQMKLITLMNILNWICHQA